MRVFIAFELPDEIVNATVVWQRHNAPQGVFVEPPSNLHMTLAFIGEVDEKLIEPIKAILARLDPSTVTLNGPTRYVEQAKLAFLEYDEIGGQEVWAYLNMQLKTLYGYEPQFSPWLAHTTVWRFAPDHKPNIDPPLMNLSFQPKAVHLYTSIKNPNGGGGIYQKLASNDFQICLIDSEERHDQEDVPYAYDPNNNLLYLEDSSGHHWNFLPKVAEVAGFSVDRGFGKPDTIQQAYSAMYGWPIGEIAYDWKGNNYVSVVTQFMGKLPAEILNYLNHVAKLADSESFAEFFGKGLDTPFVAPPLDQREAAIPPELEQHNMAFWWNGKNLHMGTTHFMIFHNLFGQPENHDDIMSEGGVYGWIVPDEEDEPNTVDVDWGSDHGMMVNDIATDQLKQQAIDAIKKKFGVNVVQRYAATKTGGTYLDGFGYFDGKLYRADFHHADIIKKLIDEEGYTWQDLMDKPALFGWLEHTDPYSGEPRQNIPVRFSTGTDFNNGIDMHQNVNDQLKSDALDAISTDYLRPSHEGTPNMSYWSTGAAAPRGQQYMKYKKWKRNLEPSDPE